MPLNIVIQTAFLGDLLLSIPLLKEMKRQWPNHRLGLVCRKGLGDILKKLNLVDEIYEIEKGNRQAYVGILNKFKSENIDYLVSPHQSTRTLLFVAQIKAQYKIGFKSFLGSFVYKTRVTRDLRLPDALRQMSLLSPVNAKLKSNLEEFASQEKPYSLNDDYKLPDVPAWGSMGMRAEFFKSDEIFLQLKSKFHLEGFEEGNAVLLFPGSVWATKRWTEVGFIEAACALKAAGKKVYIMGGPGEEELSERVANAVGCYSLAGKTKIYESAHLIARAALLIGNDSASTHLAAVTQTPLIAVFGPTILEFGYRPWSSQAYIRQTELSCRPCGKHGHHVCPIKTHDCMKNVSGPEVFRTSQHILSK